MPDTRHHGPLLIIVAAFCLPVAVEAQTSYPMLMSIHPVAAEAGHTSEHTIKSRYSMYGAWTVLVSGDGVAGEVMPHAVKAGEKEPSLTSLKVRFTVDKDALPGVRDIRLATPRGVSTVGQLVIVQDPVISEAAKNNTANEAEDITLPATLCGAIERAEDVDFFRFKVDQPQSLVFHVRCMRLQDRIHDLQTHADPIIALRSANGSTLATADNSFFGDPLLHYRFSQPGEYLLEIRDVRYQGNTYWEYSIEASSRPFVSTVFPVGIAATESATVELIGPSDDNTPHTATVTAAETGTAGLALVRPANGNDAAGPVPVSITELPVVTETADENNRVENGQLVSVPATINGRIDSDSDIDVFLFEAKKGESFSFEVVARRAQSQLDSHLRILAANGKALSENDDLKLYRLTFADSWIENWKAPADGTFAIEIRDLHLRGGDAFVYAINATRPEPTFELYLDTDKTHLAAGTSAVLFASAVRKNGFTGEVQLHIDGLPDGVRSSAGRILADKGRDGSIVLTADPTAKPAVANVTVRGSAVINASDGEQRELSIVAVPYQETYQPGGGRGHWQVDSHTVAVAETADLLAVNLSTHELTLSPGESQSVDVEIVRAPGFDKNVQLDPQFRHLSGVFADTLPPGVTVDAKKSRTLLTGTNTKGQITFAASTTAAPAERQQVAIMANVSLNFVMKWTYSSEPLLITVAPKP